MKKLAWIDLETCGLSPNANPIVEVGLIVTDHELTVLDRYEGIVHCEKEYVYGGPVDQAVIAMHEKSGLWERSFASTKTNADVELEAVRFLEKHFEGEKNVGPMCGSSVHFDRAFIKLRMPELHRQFGYRNIDVSSIKQALGLLGIEDITKTWPYHHTALSDLHRSIAEFRQYLNFMKAALDAGVWLFRQEEQR